MSGWRVLPLRTGGSERLLDEGLALFESLTHDPRPAVRWYRSTDTAVVFGRGQRTEPAAAGTLPLLTRASGGGAVLMTPALLACDVLLPADDPLLTGDLGRVFLHVGEAWASALRDLGVPGLAVHGGPAAARRRGTPRERALAAICFATLGRGEVTAGGRKLVGLSQRRRRAGAMIQCGLLLAWDPNPLLALVGTDAADVAEEVVRAAVGLEDLVEEPPPIDRIVEAVTQALLTRAGAVARHASG